MKIYWILCLALAACGGGGQSSAPASTSTPQTASSRNNVGFFTPRGVPPELVGKTGFSMINAESPEQVALSLQTAKNHAFRVDIDLGPVLALPASTVGTTYSDISGATYTKVLAPLPAVKLRQFPPDDQIRSLVAPYLDVMKGQSNLGTVYLADEPYINGISKGEMERAGRVVREQMNGRGINVKLGVIFASGMFNANFASRIDAEAGEFVKRIDTFYQSGFASAQYISTIQTTRLTTYDAAGNMYKGGGLPEGFEVVDSIFICQRSFLIPYMSTRLHGSPNAIHQIAGSLLIPL